MKVTVEVEVKVHTGSPNKVIPTFYQDAATVDDAPFDEVGVSLSNPFVFYLFSKDNPGPNGEFLATLNMQEVLNAIANQWPEIGKEG